VTTPRIAEPDWYVVPIERSQLRALQNRTNYRGLIRVAIYLLLLALFARLAVAGLGIGWTVLFFILYGSVYTYSDSIEHETHHRTAFRNIYLNAVVHWIAGVLTFKEAIRDRWVHARHHTYTQYRGVDFEFMFNRPPNIFLGMLNVLFGVVATVRFLGYTARDAIYPLAPMSKPTRTCVPVTEYRKASWSARAKLTCYLGVIGLAIGLHVWWPILFLFGARMVSAYHGAVSVVHHSGLAEDVPDWRLNTRSVLVNPITRLLHWNMNFHLEHHMFPTVPFHSLPRLHNLIGPACPPPYKSTVSAWREMLPALMKQRGVPDYFVQRSLPA
jgi:fatty acid desaturase